MDRDGLNLSQAVETSRACPKRGVVSSEVRALLSTVVMNASRRIQAALVVSCASFAAACAPPTPGESIEGSGDALSQSATPKMVAGAAYNPATGEVTETAFLGGRQQSAAICVAFDDGSADAQAACNDYPNGFTDMSCHDEVATGIAPRVGRYTSACHGSGFRNAAPFDKGDGNYRIVIVDKSHPTNRSESSVLVAGADAQLKLVADDGTVTVVTPGTTTSVQDSLRVRLEVPAAAAAAVKGCMSTFVSEGLSNLALSFDDAFAIRSCSVPTVELDTADGWTTQSGSPTADRTEISFDATPLLTQKRHVIFGFEVNGSVLVYTFAN